MLEFNYVLYFSKHFILSYLFLMGHDLMGFILKKNVLCAHIFCILEAPLIKHIVLALSSAYQNK